MYLIHETFIQQALYVWNFMWVTYDCLRRALVQSLRSIYICPVGKWHAIWDTKQFKGARMVREISIERIVYIHDLVAAATRSEENVRLTDFLWNGKYKEIVLKLNLFELNFFYSFCRTLASTIYFSSSSCSTVSILLKFDNNFRPFDWIWAGRNNERAPLVSDVL